MKLRMLMIFILVVATLVAQAQAADTVVLVTHDSFAISESLLDSFEAQTGLAVEVLRAGDAGQMVNQAILSKNNPLGDVLYGVDNTFLSRALAGEIFAAYQSPALDTVAAQFLRDDFFVTPVDFGDVCLNYDIAWFEENELSLPQSLAELADEKYAGLLAVQNPATSSPGLAFLLATIANFGEADEGGYLDYWAALRANDVLVADGWTDAYYGEFTIGSRGAGTRPLVVSYASSPPAEVIYAEDPSAGAVTGALIEDGMCFRQVEYVGALQGSANQAGAQLLIDFMLSAEFQADMPLNMFVFPVVEGTELPAEFVEYAQVPAQPAFVAPADIEAKREAWIQAWA
ncbi:MAG: thiamine ABC transporter substrate-binding protein, partial [Chloroflexi bacterium]|nr:thiamine ABC transporter substrate-binding protein [Chloroflexota bacterium]